MKREAMQALYDWKKSSNRKPLIVNGARQVGKTWLLKEFGKSYFKNTAYISFDRNSRAASLFEGDLSPKRLLPLLEAESGQPIEPNETLIILDEIQEAPGALRSLKYFNEEASELAVVAAGSALGLQLRNTSFPVGKVSFLEMYPMSFSEFLIALGFDRYASFISKMEWEQTKLFHEELMELIRIYLYVGGLPEVVSTYVETKSFSQVRSVQEDLLKSYYKDFSRHASNQMAERLRQIWRAIPANLSQENKKFIFKRVRPSARGRDYEEGLQWLEDASLIRRVTRVNVAKAPLTTYEDEKAFKVYFFDVGLLGAMCGLRAQTILGKDEVFQEFKGALGEQLVLQEAFTAGLKKVFYFQNDATKTEIDFIIDGNESIKGPIPIEVKYGTNLNAKSLMAFVKKNSPELALRVSAAQYSQSEKIINLPHYAIASFLANADSPKLADYPVIAEARNARRAGTSNKTVDSIFELLKGAPLHRRDLIYLLKERFDINVEPQELSVILGQLKKDGTVRTTGAGLTAKWEIVATGGNDFFRLFEGESHDTGLRSASLFGLLEMISDNDYALSKLAPSAFWLLDASSWRDLVDSFLKPEDEYMDPVDMVKETGIPRDLKPGQFVVDAYELYEPIVKLIDIQISLEDVNELLREVFEYHGLRIIKGLSDAEQAHCMTQEGR